MTDEQNPYMITIKEFVASRQVMLFHGLKQTRFSGQLLLKAPRGNEWVFYLYLGRIIYATGGHHRVRRWRRNIASYASSILVEAIQGSSFWDTNSGDWHICWEYELLCTWVEQQKISREDAARVIRSVLTEILFDVTQMGEVVYLIKTEPLLSKQLVLIDAEQVIVETWKMWQVWQGAQLADRSPNLAPVIKQKAQLQANTSPKTYEVLFKLLDGDRTLRELAIQMKKDILQITRSLMPYIQLGFVELIEVLDLPPPIELVQPQVVKSEQDRPAKASKDYLIACIDDSPLICQAMERIITGAGYRYLSEMDGLRAIAVLLASKPDLIFLDLVMLNANGYELCAQLRKLSCFKETPIIIFTGNVNLIDRLRAKMVGCNDLLKKPLEGNVILTTIARHLEIGSSVYIASSEY